jgi:hypothetical protein
MKTQLFSLAAAAQLLLGQIAPAQGPISTGIVQGLSQKDGTLTIRTEQSGAGTMVYHGMDKADILTANGKPAVLADIAPGQQVTVFYAKQGDQWMVSRVLLPDPKTTIAPVATIPPRVTPSDVDGDRTTRGPESAAFDGDRTTVPADRNANRDGDRTTSADQKK